ncbi:uncharacterized protein LOC133188026 [Saccostrea echinata]|uniref:uncharacterized protein LOC133188026 n=1 Tax=Saccostrea echinata TaxID=191078 RepID=UPI002A822D34|nr:uncharacterized protein LOC133188026 [Saccostrea echinata]
MANVAKTYTPKTAQELKEALEKCLKEKKVPVFLSRKNVNEKSLIDDEELKDIEVAFIDVEKLKQKEEVGESPTATEAMGVNEETMQELQALVGATPIFRIEKFQNWAATQESCVISCNPKTRDEMTKVIKAASEVKVGIRCAGQRHSWAPVFPDDNQICINVEDMISDYGWIQNSNCREKREVDVMTGATTGDLKKFQLKHKMNLKTNVILDVVQMVSVVVTGCHGVGEDTHCLSDYVVRMRVFDSKGDLKTYCINDDPKERFRAMSASFGCFGIVYDVTLKMDKELIIKTDNSYKPLKDVFKTTELKNIVTKNWAVQIFWFPFNAFPFGKYDLEEDDVWVRTFNKETLSDEENVKGKLYYALKAVSDYGTEEGLRIVSPYLTEYPKLVPIFQKSAFSAIKHLFYPEGPIYQELPHAVHFRKYIEKAEVYDLEFVFDYHDDFDTVLKIINVVVESVKSYYDRDQYPLNVSLEMRFMAYSDAYLGTGILGNKAKPYCGSGHVVCIEILSLKGTPQWTEFSKDVGRKWMDLGGVPHLAKQYDHIPGIFNHVREKMEYPIKLFKEQLDKSGADPNGMFLNSGMRELLGLNE